MTCPYSASNRDTHRAIYEIEIILNRIKELSEKCRKSAIRNLCNLTRSMSIVLKKNLVQKSAKLDSEIRMALRNMLISLNHLHRERTDRLPRKEKNLSHRSLRLFLSFLPTRVATSMEGTSQLCPR